MEVYHLGSWDHVVIALFLFASLAIGLLFSTKKTQRTSGDFMLAGRDMSLLPVTLSLVVTHLSAGAMIGLPAEVYRYGTQSMINVVGVAFGMVTASKLMVPIFFKLGITSVYQYLQMRYGKCICLSISGLFLVQTIIFMSVVLKAPALALSATTDLSMEVSVIVMGVVCVIYCSLGGLKAVLWTDSFQSALMFAFLLIMFFVGTQEAGGLDEIIHKAKEGGRWIFFDSRFDFVTRFTVWNVILRGVSFGVSAYGMSQLEIQRLLSIKDLKRAQLALYLSIAPILGIIITSKFIGLVLYAIFYGCDPVLDKGRTGLRRHDQLVPYYLVTRLGHIPGLTGLCISGLFGGALSTLSSAINSVATVTIVDFVRPNCARLSDTALLLLTKILVLVYGVAVIGLTFALANVGTLVQMSSASISITEGPTIAIFLLGILTSRNTEKGSIIGFFFGCLAAGWAGFGSILSGYVYPPMQLSNDNCLNTSLPDIDTLPLHSTQSSAIHPTTYPESSILPIHRISYMWLSTIGFVVTAFVSYAVSIITDWNHKEKTDPKFLSPYVRLWTKISPDDDDAVDGVTTKMLADEPRIKIFDGKKVQAG